MLSNKDLLQKPSARAPHFEAIWEKTKGTDFDKTLAMLKAYCETKNWGTHSKSVWSVVEKYVGGLLGGGYCKTVKDKNVLLFKIEFLLLQLSEKIDFNKIKVDGGLAAIFHVIFTHTNINAYDFAQGTELYATYEKRKDPIMTSVFKESDWGSVFKGAELCSYRIRADKVSALLSAKLINYIDSWILVVEQGDLNRLDAARVGLYRQYDRYCVIADKDFSELFHSKEIQNYPEFIRYLYCKKYNLDLVTLRHSTASVWVNMVKDLCDATIKEIDGVLLLYIIKVMQNKGLIQPGLNEKEETIYEMLIKLIEKRHLFENWNDLEKILIDNNELNLFDLLQHAVENGFSVDTVRYLLEEKKAKIDIKSLSKTPGSYTYFNYDMPKTLVQTLIASPSASYYFTALLHPEKRLFERFIEILKILVRHDPYCVCIKDKDKSNIFYYLNEVSKSFYEALKRPIYSNLTPLADLKKQGDDFFEAAYSIIQAAFHHQRAFTFFHGGSHNDEKNNIKILPRDVLNLISEYTVHSEITVRKTNI